MTTRTWWRAAVAGVGLAGAGYALFPDAVAQPPRPAEKAAEPAAWSRSSSPLVPAAASAQPMPPRGVVVPATPPLPPLPTPDAKAPVLPVPGVPLPAVPPMPQPAPPPPLPALPQAPMLAPPAPPVNPVQSVQPATPAKADSPLRSPDAGNTVKTDAGWKSSAVAPPPRAVTPPAPPAVADRPKPPVGPVEPSERDVFPLPAAPPVAVTPPAPPAPTVPPAPGADPMNLRSTTAAAVIGGALALPAPAAPPLPGGVPTVPTSAQVGKDGKDTRTTDEKITDIEKSLRRLTDALDGRKDEKGFTLPSDPGLLEEVRRLRNEVALLKTQMEAMKTTVAQRPATGGAAPGVPNPMPAGDPTAGKGVVRVVNEYPIEITMAVNTKTYRVAPATTLDIPVPMGDFSYQLLTAGTALAPTRSTIRERETVTLRIK